jgi:DNA modification methylase
MKPSKEVAKIYSVDPAAPAPPALLVEMWPINRPIPYARNARKPTDRALDVIAASLKEFGFRQPIVVDTEDVIVAGHKRLLGAMKLGLEEVPVHVATGLTPAQIKAYRIMDNRSAQEADWDYGLLGGELLELKALDIDLSLTGFATDELARLLITAGLTDGLTDADAAPEPPAIATTVLGDRWLLGDHVVLCGDSTSLEAAQRLCGDAKPLLVFTDPPYNVDYEGYTDEKLKIAGDKRTADEFSVFLGAVFRVYRAVVADKASLYVCHASSSQRAFQTAIECGGFEVRCQIIWAKNTFAWGFGRYKFQHEPIFYCHVAGVADDWYGNRSQSTLWEEKKPAANRLHPTMKPVALVERALVNSSEPGDAVLDLFGGAGSTLIACQKTGRRSLLMELDPKYVDVIVNRWQDFAGKDATLEGDGRTFKAVKAERVSVPPVG